MLDKRKWIQDPENKDIFYSVMKNVSSSHIVVECSAFKRYKVLKGIPELPAEIIEILKNQDPKTLEEINKIVPSKKERELARVREALARFVGDENGANE